MFTRVFVAARGLARTPIGKGLRATPTAVARLCPIASPMGVSPRLPRPCTGRCRQASPGTDEAQSSALALASEPPTMSSTGPLDVSTRGWV